MLMREVILENFMSYEYARIPLKSGLNVICGPNGSGKSTILLAISVALGQAYTERSKRLSDLVRWGEEGARVTVVFDNTLKKGGRPVPKFDVDYLRVSRYIRKDGNYWFEANFKVVNKSEVTSILKDFGINPENMLIIMHQHMMESFGMTTSGQRLLMVEEAIGLSEYRQHILEAQGKLSRVLSEEESVKNLLETAEETLAYWKEEYERYQRRRDLLRKRDFLERELIWARMIRQERIMESWRGKIGRKKGELANLIDEIGKTRESVNKLNTELDALRYEQRESFYSLLTLEKEKTENDVTAKIQGVTLSKVARLKEALQGGSVSASSSDVPLKGRSPKALHVLIGDLDDYVEELSSQVKLAEGRVNDLENKIAKTRTELAGLERKIFSVTEKYLDERVREGLLNYRKGAAEEELRELNRELRTAERELDQLKPSLERGGSRIETQRRPQEVSEEVKITSVQLASLGEVSKDVEKMYSKYLSLFNELKAKAAVVSENRERALREISERKKTWSRLLRSILNDVSVTYQEFLSRVEGRGYVRLTDAEDIETAGLEMFVGFKGAEPSMLDAYTQSGGERSTATMAFLLALQQHLKSPFRAVDEFDVHMDPRNREIISDMLLGEVRSLEDIQYVSITPGQIMGLVEDVHVITVQNVEGKSEVKVVVDA